MSNTIIIKNGENAPPQKSLLASELGFDRKNKLLYVGIENDTQQIENFCLNPWMYIDSEQIAFDVSQQYEDILEESITTV